MNVVRKAIKLSRGMAAFRLDCSGDQGPYLQLDKALESCCGAYVFLELESTSLKLAAVAAQVEGRAYGLAVQLRANWTPAVHGLAVHGLVSTEANTGYEVEVFFLVQTGRCVFDESFEAPDDHGQHLQIPFQ